MEQSADVVIVSVFGRGEWLASELSHQGWRVTLIDISEQMGEWSPEEAEGPFGFLQGQDLLSSHNTRIQSEGEASDVDEGMVFWTADGPLECKSEMTSFLLQQKVAPEIQNYLRESHHSARELGKARSRLRGLNYDQTWIANLSHQLASTVFVENHRALDVGVGLPVFSHFMVRRPTQDGRMKSLKACQASGVKIRLHAKIRDVRLHARNFDAIEVEDEHSGIERGKAFVWMLSSAETRHFSPSIAGKLFPDRLLKPAWFWTRFAFKLEVPDIEEQVPLWTAVVEDHLLPWTHTNLTILHKRKTKGDLSAWVRLPIWTRFDRGYHKKIVSELELLIAKKLPGSQPQLKILPTEAKYYDQGDTVRAEAKLGPPRFPVFDEGALKRVPERSGLNLFFDGPEHWQNYGWLGMFRHQMQIINKLQKLKAIWDANVHTNSNLSSHRNIST
jgi:hypothetical protein